MPKSKPSSIREPWETRNPSRGARVRALNQNAGVSALRDAPNGEPAAKEKGEPGGGGVAGARVTVSVLLLLQTEGLATLQGWSETAHGGGDPCGGGGGGPS